MEFSQIAVLLAIAGAFGIVARFFRQPLLIGYLLAGLFLGITGIISDTETVSSLGQIGVTLLLFLLGLEMKLADLPSIGKVALMTGIGQIAFTSTIGFFLARILGFGVLPSVYIAIALTFSSTIIMVKLLSEKKDLSSLYGKIAVGFLLVQDFVAIAILMFLSSVGKGDAGVIQYLYIAIKAIILFIVVWILSKRLLPTIFDRFIASSPELLFIVSIAWALGFASLVAGPIGFTLEIGGFLAGLALSNLPEHFQIASRTRPLRDFFLTLFFLYLGTQLVVGAGALSVLPSAVLFSLFVLIGNPLIVLTIMGFLGYKKRTSFLAGLTVAQISEFSLIIVIMGSSLGHISQEHVAMVVMVGVITMTISTYLILGADKIYRHIKKYLSVFERGGKREKAYVMESKLENHIILVGCDRTGKTIAVYLLKRNTPFLVVDFNPDVFTKLTAENIPVIFGDITDDEIIEASNLEKARMVISTTSNLEDNLTLIAYLKSIRNAPASVFTASMRNEAVKLYEAGAKYVIVPDVVAGDHIKHILRAYGTKGKRLAKAGKLHFNRLIFK